MGRTKTSKYPEITPDMTKAEKQRIYRMKYREEKADEIRAYARRWRTTHKEKHNEYCRKYCEKNREKMREYNRRFYHDLVDAKKKLEELEKEKSEDC